MAKKSHSGQYTTEEKATKYEMLFPILETVYNEVKELSKKKQDDVLNKLKVKLINRILEQIKEVLVDDPTHQFLDLLDDETLPSNSDAVLILAQFLATMKEFKEKYHHYDQAIGEHRSFTR